MALNCTPLSIPDVKLLTPLVFGDSRGFFQETYHADKYREIGIRCNFVQDNWSHSVKNTLRGLHMQTQKPQVKLVCVMRGTIFDVAVDMRRDSPTFGKWVSAVLSAENHNQLFIPEGFAHGFCVLSDEVDFLYKCSNLYDPADETGIAWNDPDINITWPVSTPILSKRDAALPRLKNVTADGRE